MKKKREFIRLMTLPVLLLLASCSEGDLAATLPQEPQDQAMVEEMPEETTSFNITVTNAINYLNAITFNTPTGEQEPGPLAEKGGAYTVKFKAVPGARLSFALMSVISNDWFFSPGGSGIDLFEGDTPVTGHVTDRIYLWDSGIEEENPATATSEPGEAEAGDPDDDTAVRIVETDVSSLICVLLEYDDDTRYFTLKIFNHRGAMDTEEPLILSPGIVVLHAQEDPLFWEGEPDRGHGLARIAVQGDPGDLFAWITEVCDSGNPLRLSSSFTPLSPGVVYAFEGDADPVLMEGMPAVPDSGIEEIAEEGNNSVLFDYISGQMEIPVATSSETAPVPPGQSLNFTLEVPQGYSLGFATMFGISNDWFFSFGNSGFALFDEEGNPKSGKIATYSAYLLDAGTETDQPIGFGPDQAPFQAAPGTGEPDGNPNIRRVMEIDDVQFGKGLVASEPGIAGFGDPRGGYNLIEISVEPNQN